MKNYQHFGGGYEKLWRSFVVESLERVLVIPQKKKEKKKLAEILMCWLGSAAVPAGNAPVYNQNIIK